MEGKSIEAYKDPVPYIVYESTMARMERTIKKLWIMLIIMVVVMFASNAVWLYEWNQYDYQGVIMDNQDCGNANYMGNGASGVINNGTGDSADKN